MSPEYAVENFIVFYIAIGIFVLIMMFAIIKATILGIEVIKLRIEAGRREKETKEARRCPICASTSFEDKSLEGVETSQENVPSDSIEHFVRRTCSKCGNVWDVKVTTRLTLESESYSLPDGFYGPPYKYK